MFCSECGHDMRLTDEPICETFRGEEFVVEGVEHYACDECGNYAVSAKASDLLAGKLADAYAKAHGMLAPDEVKALRKSLRLNQAEFEELLGVSRPTVCRWERGSVMQTKTADLLMRVTRDVPGVAAYLGGLAGVSVRSRVVQPIGGGREEWSAKGAGKAGVPSVDVEEIKTEEIGLVA